MYRHMQHFDHFKSSVYKTKTAVFVLSPPRFASPLADTSSCTVQHEQKSWWPRGLPSGWGSHHNDHCENNKLSMLWCFRSAYWNDSEYDKNNKTRTQSRSPHLPLSYNSNVSTSSGNAGNLTFWFHSAASGWAQPAGVRSSASSTYRVPTAMIYKVREVQTGAGFSSGSDVKS